MKKRFKISAAHKTITISLVIAFFGVITQIIAGHPYPSVPPVFFILLVPAALIIFVRSRWVSIVVILGGLFLIFGFFASGSATRMLSGQNLGDSAGLAVQMAGVSVATAASFIALFGNRHHQTA